MDPASANRYCTACRRGWDALGHGPDGRLDAKCPGCNALERHRFLTLVLDRLGPVVDTARHVLEIAPHPQIRRNLIDRVGRRYHAIDLYPATPYDVLTNAQRMAFAKETFDVVVCYHVLEHVRDDAAAMSELHRVLTPSGIAIVQVPRRRGYVTVEDPDAPEHERIERFGQADHVRYYGDDFERHLERHALHPVRLAPGDVLQPDEIRRYALVADEEVWICFRQPTGVDVGIAVGAGDLFTNLVRACFGLERAYSTRLYADLVQTLDRARDAERRARAEAEAAERIRSHPLVRLARKIRHTVTR